MFIVLSPAKTLDYDNPLPTLPTQTEPRFLDDSAELVRHMRDWTAADLAALMKVSDKIARLNVERFSTWRKNMNNAAARPAVFAFRGGVYVGLDIDQFNQRQLKQAQSRLRILSGLYGLLRPLDRIRPYRLEMGTRLPNERGRNLYQFWSDKLTRRLAQDMRAADSKVLVNLASREYFKVIEPGMLPGPVVSPVFQDEKNGRYKVISFLAKKARGRMTAWILRNRISRPEELADFDLDGYTYAARQSTPEAPIFRRPETR
jgi:cytoplasmic iron level regulating protein YaaA (DUF328/UPF0246 family)